MFQRKNRIRDNQDVEAAYYNEFLKKINSDKKKKDNAQALSRIYSSCLWPYDYSYYNSSPCANCKFCSINKRPNNIKITWCKSWHMRKKSNYAHLLEMPLIISRYCDPLSGVNVYKHSYNIMRYVLEKGGKIIFRTTQNDLPDTLIKLMKQYTNNIQYQPKLFATDSAYGKIIRQELCCKRSSYTDMKIAMQQVSDLGIHVVPFISDLILKVNDEEIIKIINDLSSMYNKFIVRQVFATLEFKSYLINISQSIGKLLNHNVNSLFTYDSVDIIDIFLSQLNNEKVFVSFCGNFHLNKLLNINNCCFYKGIKVKENNKKSSEGKIITSILKRDNF